MIQDKVIKALQKGVLAAVLASADNDLPIKFPLVVFTPPSDGKWLEVVQIINNKENEFWDEGKTYMGIMRLLLHWPSENTGAYTPIELAQSIAGYFTIGRKLPDTGDDDTGTVFVNITNEPNITGILEDAADNLIPISVRYSYFKAP